MHIEATDLSLNHPDGTPALHGITLTIAPGQFCAVLGSSGAGKTSFLRVLGGLAAPSSGTLRLDGHEPCARTLPALRRRIGQVHQTLALVRQSTSAANIVAGAAGIMPFWRALTGLYPAWARDRTVHLHLALGLDADHLPRPVGALSGGQQQRVAIARALMAEPELLLADEPVASLDSATAARVLDLIKARQRDSGMTVVCALHQPELACAFADRIVVLEKGHVAFDGDAAAYHHGQLARVPA